MKQFSQSAHRRTAFMALLALLFATASVAAEPAPKVAPAPAGAHGFPFMSSALDLGEFGYVEEEFLLAGTARAFIDDGPLGTDGKWTAKPNPGVTAKYTTRLLVRRPNEPKRFNGTVVVEWFNVSGGVDAAPDWVTLRDELLREGYAWVGVSAQLVGVSTLQSWESGPDDRYATVSHPGDSFSYDIFSQAARAIRAPADAVAPLAELTDRVRELLAVGESQSAGRLVTYFNAVHPLTNVFDGFLIHSTGRGSPLSQSAGGGLRLMEVPAPAHAPATPDVVVPPTAWIRTDQEAPVLFVNTESEITLLGASRGVHLQPDSEGFRMWELAGTSHADRSLLEGAKEDAAKTTSESGVECGDPPVGDGPQSYAVRAALHALRTWTRDGVAPARAPRLDVTIPAPPEEPSLGRDPATGLAIGGLRLPPIAVPTATETAVRPAGALAANRFCFLFGASDPWNGDKDPWDSRAGFDPSPKPEPDLRTLYPTHADYVRKVKQAAADSVSRGFLRPADAEQIVSRAERAAVPE